MVAGDSHTSLPPSGLASLVGAGLESTGGGLFGECVSESVSAFQVGRSARSTSRAMDLRPADGTGLKRSGVHEGHPYGRHHALRPHACACRVQLRWHMRMCACVRAAHLRDGEHVLDVGGDALAAELLRSAQALPRGRERHGDAAVAAARRVQADDAAAAVDQRLGVVRQPRVAHSHQGTRPRGGVKELRADADGHAVRHPCTLTMEL